MSEDKNKNADVDTDAEANASKDVSLDYDKLAEAVAKQYEHAKNLGKKAAVKPVYEPAAKVAEDKAKGADFIKAYVDGDVNKAKEITLESYKGHKFYHDIQKALNTSDDSTLVPVQFETSLAKNLEDYSQLRSRADVMQVSTNSIQFNEQDAKPSVSIIGENASITNTEQDQSHRTMTVLGYKGITSWTLEFEQDVEIDILQSINEDFAESIGEKEEDTFLNRADAGEEGLFQVSGVQTYDLGGSTTSGSTSITNITVEDIQTAYAELKDSGLSRGRNAALFIDPIALNSAFTNAKANEDIHMFTFTNGRLTGVAGLPVVEMQGTNMPADGVSTKFAFIADLSKTLRIGDRMGTRIDIGESDGDFENARKSLRVIKRTGHTITLPENIMMLVTAAS